MGNRKSHRQFYMRHSIPTTDISMRTDYVPDANWEYYFTDDNGDYDNFTAVCCCRTYTARVYSQAASLQITLPGMGGLDKNQLPSLADWIPHQQKELKDLRSPGTRMELPQQTGVTRLSGGLVGMARPSRPRWMV